MLRFISLVLTIGCMVGFSSRIPFAIENGDAEKYWFQGAEYYLDKQYCAAELAFDRPLRLKLEEDIVVLYEQEKVFSREGCGGGCIGGCLGGIIGIGIVLIFVSPYEEAYIFGPPSWPDEALNIVLAGMIVGVIAGYIIGNS